MTFFRIDSKLDTAPVVLGQEDMRYGQMHDGVFRGLIYHAVDRATQQRCLDIVPEKHRHLFSVSHLTINHGEITPHTDSNVLVSINVYLRAGGFKTTFYRPNRADVVGGKIKNQTNGRVYDPACLEAIGDFSAQDGEIWALDVSQIHGVTNHEYQYDCTRDILVIQTSQLKFDSVAEIFRDHILASGS